MTRCAADLIAGLFPDAAAVLLTTSCTHALELAALTLGIGPGDEVIVPSFTFVSTANAFALRGATVRFSDIDPTTLCMAPESVTALLTARTKAIVPVHYAGVGCDMPAIGSIANQIGAVVVEDNAHGLFGALDGRRLGSWGKLSSLSFHETKNISAGEGGALVVNDEALLARAEIARDKGTNRGQFLRGEVDKYTWVGVGSSWLPSEYTAAVLIAALEHAAVTQRARHALWSQYYEELSEWSTNNGVRLPVIPPNSTHPAHMFYLLMANRHARDRLIEHLRDDGVQAVFHYVPLDSSPYAQSIGHAPSAGACPVTADVSGRLVRLPLYADLTEDALAHVISSVQDFTG